MTVALLVGFGVLIVAIVVLPYLSGWSVAPVPEAGDPEARDLEEERDALVQAIRELEHRDDLTAERRQQLRDRYERKAAIVTARLAEHYAGPPRPLRRRAPVPLAAGLLLLLVVPSIALVGGYVLPRVSVDGTVTTNRRADIDAGRDLRRLRRAVRDDPTVETLSALGDAYWRLFESSLPQGGSSNPQGPRFLEETRETYQRLVEVASQRGAASVLATGLRRLAYVDLVEGNAPDALTRLERAVDAAPNDAEALYTLGQVRYALGQVGAAAEAWRAYLATPVGEGDDATAQLAAAAEGLAPLIDAAEEERSADNLLALADALWESGDRDRAAGFYAEIVTELGVEHPRAVRRLGMALFFAGNNEQAVLALERARALDPREPETLLFLGNAYRSLDRPARAVEAWSAYVDAVGGEANAGRVPGLIAAAQAGDAVAADVADDDSEGAALFAANCATCHGPSGGGGVGPRLAGNPRVRDASMVENTVRFGRGMMPGFGSLLDDDDVERLVAFVGTLASP